jgi:hypothetical protein
MAGGARAMKIERIDDTSWRLPRAGKMQVATR